MKYSRRFIVMTILITASLVSLSFFGLPAILETVREWVKEGAIIWSTPYGQRTVAVILYSDEAIEKLVYAYRWSTSFCI